MKAAGRHQWKPGGGRKKGNPAQPCGEIEFFLLHVSLTLLQPVVPVNLESSSTRSFARRRTCSCGATCRQLKRACMAGIESTVDGG